MTRRLPNPAHDPDVPSNSFSWFLREAVRRIWVSKRTSFVAIGMIAIALFILGGFLLVAENLSEAVTRARGGSRVKIYLDTEATPDQIRGVDQFLASHAELSVRRFVSREEALKRFKSYFSNLSGVVDQLDGNPFPASFEVETTAATAQSVRFSGDMTLLRALPGVDQVQYDWEWLNRLRRIVYVINVTGLIAGGVLALAAAFTIANVIRLAMLTYREEIEIMRLVGATERIIRGPFLIEGILQGVIGGTVAVLLLLVCFVSAREAMASSSSLLWSFLFTTFLPWQKIAALVAGGTLAGWFGSWLSVRERIEE